MARLAAGIPGIERLGNRKVGDFAASTAARRSSDAVHRAPGRAPEPDRLADHRRFHPEVRRPRLRDRRPSIGPRGEGRGQSAVSAAGRSPARRGARRRFAQPASPGEVVRDAGGDHRPELRPVAEDAQVGQLVDDDGLEGLRQGEDEAPRERQPTRVRGASQRVRGSRIDTRTGSTPRARVCRSRAASMSPAARSRSHVSRIVRRPPVGRGDAKDDLVDPIGRRRRSVERGPAGQTVDRRAPGRPARRGARGRSRGTGAARRRRANRPSRRRPASARGRGRPGDAGPRPPARAGNGPTWASASRAPGRPAGIVTTTPRADRSRPAAGAPGGIDAGCRTAARRPARSVPATRPSSSSGAPEQPTAGPTGLPTIGDRHDPVHHDVVDAGRIAMRLELRRLVDDGPRIEHDDVGECLRPQDTPVNEPDPLSRDRTQLGDRALEREGGAVADISPEDAWSAAVAARVGAPPPRIG